MAKGPRRIVVKVGSSTVTGDGGRLDRANMKQLVNQIVALRAAGIECVLVTSGAIAAGLERLNIGERPKEISKLQAAAAVGQGLLIHEYTSLFKSHDVLAAQILLTQFDMAHRELYLNARQTINQILLMGVVPIVNENDTTVVEEIKLGDNDMIAALVAVLIGADLLVILSDIDGLYGGDPRTKEQAGLISRVKEITPQIEEMAAGVGTRFGSGGMTTKINAAKIAGAGKVGMYIANGRDSSVLERIAGGEEVGTYFMPQRRKVSGKKLWIGYGSAVRGRIIVDNGAAEAILRDGRSLLPAGVVKLEGDFAIGDTVEVALPEGQVVARGISNYGADELAAAKGKRTKQIATELGADFSEEVIHRDFMVIL